MTNALQQVDRAANDDAKEENDARNYLDSVKRVGFNSSVNTYLEVFVESSQRGSLLE